MEQNYTMSRYTRTIRLSADSEARLLYSSYTGAIAEMDAKECAELNQLLSGMLRGPYSAAVQTCIDSGFIVEAGTDELKQAAALRQATQESRSTHLILMPTEACNFRCSYCYQHFPRGGMSDGVKSGLRAYVQDSAQRMEQVSVSWFGGEPLLEYDTILELSDSFLASCSGAGISYSADMSTNGYFLTRERFLELVRRHVTRFMVTIDGSQDIHDARRMLRGGGGSYRTIMQNLLDISDTSAVAYIDLRVNFDRDNEEHVRELLSELSGYFSHDKRFRLSLQPVGRWGGPRDEFIPVCARNHADQQIWGWLETAQELGLSLSHTMADSLLPSGSVCYAAKPNSFVIGSDGRLYKCSLALDEEANQVGQLLPDGSMKLDDLKMAKWTSSGEEQDEGCRACFFRPACQGSHCPLYRMKRGERPCPREKRNIKKVLQLLHKETLQLQAGR
ncbi:radical SAM/SPASM domain-containing protein [Paenibacillus turpanensis]|uniref:radical SAM/SPASM domain-containing protein n=1 Tax=Paenibacillus turpanensis TaxID=2689078 RepID=UPI00140937FE|nr:radical SAM protein [Paenibacillus turpanensis]